MPRPDWPEAIVQCLLELKQDGQDFDTAWAGALLLHPARGRDLGAYRPTLMPEPGETESVVEFTRRVAEDAWHNRRPALRNFNVSALVESSVDTGGITRSGKSQSGARLAQRTAAA
jgi:hypothetical protein